MTDDDDDDGGVAAGRGGGGASVSDDGASPVPAGALVGTGEPMPVHMRQPGSAVAVAPAARSHNDTTRDPRRRPGPDTTTAASAASAASTVSAGASAGGASRGTDRSMAYHLQQAEKQQQQQQQQQSAKAMTLPLGDRPKKEHFRLLLYKKSEKPHELSWLCLELVIQGNRNGFRVPDDLVAHHDQVIRIRSVHPETHTLPGRVLRCHFG
jgi:hypothetical protein